VICDATRFLRPFPVMEAGVQIVTKLNFAERALWNGAHPLSAQASPSFRIVSISTSAVSRPVSRATWERQDKWLWSVHRS
jgi:hypothetical protein